MLTNTPNDSAYLVILLILFSLAFSVFAFQVHILNSLLMLELFSLSLMFNFSLNSTLTAQYNFFWFMAFSLIVCEAVVGLGTLVRYSRKYGSEKMNF